MTARNRTSPFVPKDVPLIPAAFQLWHFLSHKWVVVQVGDSMALFDTGRTFNLSRRTLLSSIAAIAAVPASAAAALVRSARVRPGMPGWPSAAAWKNLSRTVGGRLMPGAAPTLTPGEAPRLMSNPFFVGDQVGLTQSSGWLGAWRSRPSVYAVRARDAADVAAAVR